MSVIAPAFEGDAERAGVAPSAPVYEVVDEKTGERYYTYEEPDQEEERQLDELLRQLEPEPVTADSPWYARAAAHVVRYAEWLGGHTAAMLGFTGPLFEDIVDDLEVERQRDEEERIHIEQRKNAPTVAEPAPAPAPSG